MNNRRGGLSVFVDSGDCDERVVVTSESGDVAVVVEVDTIVVAEGYDIGVFNTLKDVHSSDFRIDLYKVDVRASVVAVVA